MERKTMGGFIAALRKANGMTQKDLAERLNVSDKSVSRWERDDGAPDLSLIPVIAEIFGVTCDELLRGERRPAAEREAEDQVPSGGPTAKGEKQRRRLLAVSISKYRTRTLIAMGISMVGLIAAMVANFGFLRAYVGFFLGTAFYLAGAVCQAVFVNGAFLSVAEDSLEETEVGRFRWSVVRLAERSFDLTAALLGFSLPLVVFPPDAYVGLNADSWFLFRGPAFAALALLAAAVVCHVLNPVLLKKGFCVLPEKEEGRYHHNHALRGRCAAGLAACLAATLLVHAFGSEMVWSAQHLAKGTVFHDYESFIAHMEQDVPYHTTVVVGGSWFIGADVSSVAPADGVQDEAHPDDVQWYDEEGNAVSEEVARRRTLEDASGAVVCEYIHRNEMVAFVSYEAKEGTVLPITAFTEEDYQIARNQAGLINGAVCLLYPVELAAVVLIYLKKRIK